MPHTPIYTIGYGAREIEPFLEILRSHHIRYLLDVRSSPYSRYKPGFSKAALKNFMEANGIHYLFMGDVLGGQPESDVFYAGGRVDYKKVAQSEAYREGIERLHKASQQGQRVVLMCSEGKPENCHRSKLIGKTLAAEGVEVLHIDENDALITQKEVLNRLTGGQPSLFGDDFFEFKSNKRYRENEERLDNKEPE
jgi:uncharacterized protein (DUF488 family)